MNVVAHNLQAMNAGRQLGITEKESAKLTEQLSSGYRINRASDDAAGLAISEKMRRQIRGLGKAVENIQDGISLCQVADGALSEVHDILQRMNELSVKAGNDTNTQEDRSYIQAEIDALTEEIDRIAYHTTFNDEIYPLLGSSKTTVVSGEWELPNELQEIQVTFTTSVDGAIINGIALSGSQKVQATCLYYDFQDFGSMQAEHQVLGDSFIYVMKSSEWVSRRFSEGKGSISLWTDVYDYYGLTLSDLNVDNDGRIYYSSKDPGYAGQKRYLVKSLAHGGWVAEGTMYPHSSISTDYIYAKKITDGGSGGYTQKDIWIHMATEPGQGMSIDLVNATKEGIGLDKLDVSSMENAGKAIDSIKGAIGKVSQYRTTFGAQQNRMEHALSINKNIGENTTAAESRIRDTDIAKKMVKFSNINILLQAGNSILAQANQSKRGVMDLLQ